MNYIQPIWDKAKKTLKVVWRHIFTLGCLFAAIDAFISSNPILSRVLITLGIAMAIDWAKQFIKFDRNFKSASGFNDPHDIDRPLHMRQWWNPELHGSATNLISSSNRIRYD